jgi:hypothetical protein
VARNVTRAYDLQIANARLPYVSKKAPTSSERSDDCNYDSCTLEKLRPAFARNEAGNALWLVTLALRAYKLENNSYPPQLRVLVPRYLKQIPADPFGGGEELHYKRAGNTYVLWSIGPDGINNGGKPIAFEPGRAPQPGDPPRLPVVNLKAKAILWQVRIVRLFPLTAQVSKRAEFFDEVCLRGRFVSPELAAVDN